MQLANGKLLFTADDGATGFEPWILDPGATVQRIGIGCNPSGPAPTLHGTDPVLGTTFTIRGSSDRNGASVFLAVSPPASAITLGRACTLYVDPSNNTVLGPRLVVARTWSLPVFLPNVARSKDFAFVCKPR